MPSAAPFAGCDVRRCSHQSVLASFVIIYYYLNCLLLFICYLSSFVYCSFHVLLRLRIALASSRNGKQVDVLSEISACAAVTRSSSSSSAASSSIPIPMDVVVSLCVSVCVCLSVYVGVCAHVCACALVTLYVHVHCLCAHVSKLYVKLKKNIFCASLNEHGVCSNQQLKENDLT